MRTKQESSGRRPCRRKVGQRQGGLEVVSVNPTAGTTLVDELEHGTALGKPHIVLVQELAASPAGRAALEKNFARLGWVPMLGQSYLKDRGYGGGTGILSRGEPGVRALEVADDTMNGRCCIGIAECGQEIAVASLYCITGTAAHRQVPLWCDVACALARTGRPFILAADWQVHPSEVTALRLDRRLDATVISPNVATNHVSGNIIDFFLVSNSLLAAGCAEVDVVNGCRFSPHRPVRLRLAMEREVQVVRRLRQPRLLDVDRPIGPQLDADKVNWEPWQKELMDNERPNDGTMDTIVAEWAAGAEQELFAIFGISDELQVAQYSGIGLPREEIWVTSGSKFAGTPDDLGLIGHRLAWAARALHSAVSHSAAILAKGAANAERWGRAGAWQRHARWKRAAIQQQERWPKKGDDEDGSYQAAWQFEILYRNGRRAAAFLRERNGPTDRIDEAHFVRDFRVALRLLANLIRPTRQSEAVLDRWCRGDGDEVVDKLRTMMHTIDGCYVKLVEKRRRRQVMETGRWARQASVAAAHRSTKVKETITTLSASASKSHRGEATPQKAADKGADEWAAPWHGQDADMAHEVLEALEAVEVVHDQHQEISLPPH